MERRHRSLLNIERSLIFQSGISPQFWGEAVLVVAVTIHALPLKVLKWRTPYEILHNKAPNYDSFNVFGCQVHYSNVLPLKDKLQQSAFIGTFIGYSLGQKGYKIWDKEKHKFIISKDVKFSESTFPFKQQDSIIQSSTTENPFSGSEKILEPVAKLRKSSRNISKP